MLDLGFDPKKVGGLTKELASSLARVFKEAADSAERQRDRFSAAYYHLSFFSHHGHCDPVAGEAGSVCGGECWACVERERKGKGEGKGFSGVTGL